ncbi:MAG: hypothetical protein M0Q42_05890 [Xanthomonadales bacterium]|nr:hypothetical protein [Xanthomonadales bacterium]
MTIPERIGRTAALLMLLAMAMAMMAAPALAQNPPLAGSPEMTRYCTATPDCRRQVQTSVRMADGQVMTEHLPVHRPAILADSISVLLGEEVQAVPEFSRGQFRQWREARRRDEARHTIISFELTQGTDGSIAAQISNNGEDPVKLRLFVRLLGSGEEAYISSCPVAGNGSMFEYWSEPVVELLIREITVVNDDGALLCD